MVVAQLVERSLPLPEVRGSNPVIGKNLFILNICLLSTVYWKDENKEKEARIGPFFKKKKKFKKSLQKLNAKVYNKNEYFKGKNEARSHALSRLADNIGTYWPNKFKMKSHRLSNAVQIGASVNVTKAIYIGRSYLEDRSNRPLHENYKSFCTHFFNSIIRKK